jgi:hypothetical protein
MQAAINTHLSQPAGAGACDGQHGMSFAISSVVAVISSDVASIATWEDASAMTGRETGANASPAIIKIASSLRMAKSQFTDLNSHSLAASKDHATIAHKRLLIATALISVNTPPRFRVQTTGRPARRLP